MKFFKKDKLKDYIDDVRPGIITGAADNDPAGISTYSIAGSQFGFSQNWIMLIAIPMLIAVQSIVAKIGVIKQKGLNQVVREYFGIKMSILILVILILCNTFTIGADMLATSAATDTFLTNSTTNYEFFLIPVFLLLSYMIIFKNYKKIAKYMMIGSFIFVAYIITAIIVHPNWLSVLKGTFIPNFLQFFTNKNYALTATGILGTTISPYLLFWQQEEEIEEKRPFLFARKETKVVTIGFIFSQIITLFIMTASGATLFKHHINILQSKYPAIATAHVLYPLAGRLTEQLYSIGIISAGFIAIPVLAISSAYALTEITKSRSTLSGTFKSERIFYYVIILSLITGFIFAIFKIDPIIALYYSQVLDGMLAPFIVILIIIIANRKSIMGKYVNNWFENIFSILSVIIMLSAAILIFI